MRKRKYAKPEPPEDDGPKFTCWNCAGEYPQGTGLSTLFPQIKLCKGCDAAIKRTPYRSAPYPLGPKKGTLSPADSAALASAVLEWFQEVGEWIQGPRFGKAGGPFDFEVTLTRARFTVCRPDRWPNSWQPARNQRQGSLNVLHARCARLLDLCEPKDRAALKAAMARLEKLEPQPLDPRTIELRRIIGRQAQKVGAA